MPGLPRDHMSDGTASYSADFPQPLPPRFPPSTLSDSHQRMPLQQAPPTSPPDDAVEISPLVNAGDVVGSTGGRGVGHDPTKHPRSFSEPDHAQSAALFGSGCYGSADSEHDLAAMVHDFMESGSYGSDFPESSDGENGAANGPKLFETLQAQKFNLSALEKDLVSVLTLIASSIKEIDLTCLRSGECKGGCIRRLLVKHLRFSGYDAAVCISKWPNSGKVLSGEYEYIDVTFERVPGQESRLIVDMDFRSQFEIARPTHSYLAALKLLPVMFVGSEEKLGQVLQVMAEAGRLSLRQNSMPLPPWRTLDYMTAKWISPFERQFLDFQSSRMQGSYLARTKQCVEQFRNLKLCIIAETDKSHTGKLPYSDRNRALYLTKAWRSAVGGTSFSDRTQFLRAATTPQRPE